MNEEKSTDVDEGFSDEELESMSLEEANAEIEDDETWERFNELREEELMESAEENIEKWNKRDSEMMNAFKKGTSNDLTKEIELYGEDFEILIDLSDEQLSKLKEIDELSRDDLSAIDEELAAKISNKMIDFLSTICVDNEEIYEQNPGSKRFWREFYEEIIDRSVLRLYTIIESIVEKYKEEQERGKEFRS